MNFFAKTNIFIIFITENNNNNNNIETTDMCLLSNITEIEEPVPDPVFVTPEVVHIEATLRVSVDYKNEMETKEEKDEISDCDESAAATTVGTASTSSSPAATAATTTSRCQQIDHGTLGRSGSRRGKW